MDVACEDREKLGCKNCTESLLSVEERHSEIGG